MSKFSAMEELMRPDLLSGLLSSKQKTKCGVLLREGYESAQKSPYYGHKDSVKRGKEDFTRWCKVLEDFSGRVSFTVDNLVDNCYNLLVLNLPSFKEDPNIKPVIAFLVASHLYGTHDSSTPTTISGLSEFIFDRTVLQLVGELWTRGELKLPEVDRKNLTEIIRITDREKEYLAKRGVNKDFADVLKEAQDLVNRQGVKAYFEDVALSKSGDYELPAFKCLISFENEENFVKRLESPELQDRLFSYRDHIERTVIHYAAAKGKVQILQALCEIPKLAALINEGDGYGRTALHVASSEGAIEVLDCLVNHGAACEATDRFGRTALHIAAMSNRAGAVEWLVKKDHDLLETKDGYGRTALHVASSEGAVEVLDCLINHGAAYDSIDCFKRTALHIAAVSNRARAVEWLVKKDHDLLETKDGFGRTPLHLGVNNDNARAVQKLIELEANIEAQDSYGRTPLHLAASRDCVTSIQTLLRFKASLNIKDGRGKTPLYLAITKNSLGFVKALWKENPAAFTEAMDENQNNALHVAVERDTGIRVLKFLCEKMKGDLNRQNKYGTAPLHDAAFLGNYKAVKILLEAGADAGVPDNDERIPLFLTTKKLDGREVPDIVDAKIKAAVHLLNHDYSKFVAYHLREDKLIFNFGELAMFREDVLTRKLYEIEDDVYEFLRKVCNFLKKQNTILPLLGGHDHVPLIDKIEASKDKVLLQNFMWELPQFVDVMSLEDKGILLDQLHNYGIDPVLLNRILHVEAKELPYPPLENEFGKKLPYPLENDLKEFLRSPDEFVARFTEAHKDWGAEPSDVYSILLYEAVIRGEVSIVEQILEQARDGKILVHTNTMGHSPVSMAILLGNNDIITSIKNYAVQHYSLDSLGLRGGVKDLLNIETALCRAYRRSDSGIEEVKSLYNDCLCLLYSNSDEVVEYISNLIGEENVLSGTYI